MTNQDLFSHAIAAGAGAVRAAVDAGAAVVITAGAGMGVDSGLPDFRGPEGFWNAYPAYRHLGLNFMDLADPRWFKDDPALAWGFYGHRLHLYRDTRPHDGFGALLALTRRAATHVVFTSNVDGAFQRAGFAEDVVCACHGDIHTLQCSEHAHGFWSAHDVTVNVDPVTFRAAPPFPTCRDCDALARPNILMFGDWGYQDDRTTAAEQRLADALADVDDSLPHVIIESGAGTAIPSVRRFGERLLRRWPQARLVRINMRECQADDASTAKHVIGVAAGARAALLAMAEQW
jgi:NAD-dependent SIR2 family protein deacetylase